MRINANMDIQVSVQMFKFLSHIHIHTCIYVCFLSNIYIHTYVCVCVCVHPMTAMLLSSHFMNYAILFPMKLYL